MTLSEDELIIFLGYLVTNRQAGRQAGRQTGRQAGRQQIRRRD